MGRFIGHLCQVDKFVRPIYRPIKAKGLNFVICCAFIAFHFNFVHIQLAYLLIHYWSQHTLTHISFASSCLTLHNITFHMLITVCVCVCVWVPLSDSLRPHAKTDIRQQTDIGGIIYTVIATPLHKKIVAWLEGGLLVLTLMITCDLAGQPLYLTEQTDSDWWRGNSNPICQPPTERQPNDHKVTGRWIKTDSEKVGLQTGSRVNITTDRCGNIT